MNDRNFESDQRGFSFRKIGDLIENFRGVQVIELRIILTVGANSRAFIELVEVS